MNKTTEITLRILVFAVLLLMIVHSYFVLSGNLYGEAAEKQEAYQEELQAFQEKIRSTVGEKLDWQDDDFGVMGYQGMEGTVSNFEGPQVEIEAIEFHRKLINKKDSRIFFDGNTLNFDPDHPYYGLPNAVVKVSPVGLYQSENPELSKLLQIGEAGGKPSPYRIYSKTIESNKPELRDKKFKMQLWLTEFQVTIDIIPDRKSPPVPISWQEQFNTKYPGHWYGKSRPVTLAELSSEYKNNRYGDLTIVLKITPNNAPWYVKTPDMQNSRPDMAVGAVYCAGLDVAQDEDRRVSPNIQKGSVVYLHPTYEGVPPTPRQQQLPNNLEQSVTNILNDHIPQNIEAAHKPISGIWNRPYYIKLYFNNIGSWKEGWFSGNRRYDDQVTYQFIMPTFVLGSWDIIPPNEIVPEWEPPQPFFERGFRLSDLLPTWGLGNFGKTASIGLLFLAVIAAIFLFFPALIPLVNGLIKRLGKRLKQ